MGLRGAPRGAEDGTVAEAQHHVRNAARERTIESEVTERGECLVNGHARLVESSSVAFRHRRSEQPESDERDLNESGAIESTHAADGCA